jgi:hypothetical protein
MAKTRPAAARVLNAGASDPLIAVPIDEDGREEVQYFTGDQAADDALGQGALSKALSAIGSSKDIDSPDALDILDRVRHESKPTPPIDDL